MAQGRVAASWSQGKVPREETEKKLNGERKLARNRRGGWCYECRAIKPGVINSLCRKHYVAWRNKQPHMQGHCAVCDPGKANDPRPLYRLDPPLCDRCYQAGRRTALRRDSPELVKANDRRDYAAKRTRPGYLEAKRADRQRRYAEDEAYRAREAARSKGRYTPVAAMPPEEVEALRAHRRALYAARKAPGYVKPVHKKYAPAPPPPPPKQARRAYAKRITPEEAQVFGAAIESLRVEIRPSKKYRRRKAA